MDKKRKHLFLCGCARSGTTALARLVNMHPNINVCVEKYQFEFKRDEGTFLPNLYDDIASLGKAGENIYIGDKVPGFYKNYSKLFDTFPDSKVFFIYRNVIDVAQSYKKRKEDKTDAWDKGVRRAVAEWNESLVNTLEFIEKGHNIVPLVYERVFSKKVGLLQYLPGLKPNKEYGAYYKKILVHSKRLDQNRENYLTSQEKVWIMKIADFDSYRKLHKISHV